MHKVFVFVPLFAKGGKGKKNPNSNRCGWMVSKSCFGPMLRALDVILRMRKCWNLSGDIICFSSRTELEKVN